MVVLCFEILMAFAVGAFSSGVRGAAGGGGGGGGGGRKLFSKIKDKARLQFPRENYIMWYLPFVWP